MAATSGHRADPPMTSSIKIRAELRDGVTTVRALIRHPMETGSRKESTGTLVPAHFITEVVCEHHGVPLLTTYWGTGISKNPSLSFRFAGAKAGDKIRLRWVDNRGRADSAEAEIR